MNRTRILVLVASAAVAFAILLPAVADAYQPAYDIPPLFQPAFTTLGDTITDCEPNVIYGMHTCIRHPASIGPTVHVAARFQPYYVTRAIPFAVGAAVGTFLLLTVLRIAWRSYR